MVAEALNRGQLLLTLAPWDSIDDRHAARIPMDDPTENADLLRQMVAEGKATSFQLTRDGKRLGLILVRVEEGREARELVVIAVAAANESQPLTPEISAAIDALAVSQSCVSIRFHTARHGLARIACKSLGFHISEIVLRKTIQ